MALYFSCILLAGLTYKTKLFNIHTTLMSTNSLIFFLSFLLLTSSAYQSVALSFQSIVLFVSAMPLLLILQYLTPVFEYFSPLDIKQSLFQFFLSNRLWYLHQKTSYCWHQFFKMDPHDLLFVQVSFIRFTQLFNCSSTDLFCSKFILIFGNFHFL